MKRPQATLFGLAILLAGGVRAQEPGEATRRAEINVLELSREGEAALPASRTIHAPMRAATVFPAPAAPAEAAQSPAPFPGAAPGFSGFAALLDDGRRTPPDSYGAVGLQHVVTMLNSEFQVQDRTGAVKVHMTLEKFWSKLGLAAAAVVFDPRVLYDPAARRWIAVAALDPELPSSALLVGASATDDPTGNWFLYRFDVTSGGNWGDFPTAGFSANWVAVSMNLFNSDAYVHTNLYVFPKTELYAGVHAPYTLFTDTLGPFVPVNDYDGLTDRMYLLQSVQSFSGTGSLRLSEIRAEGFNAGRSSITVNDAWSFSALGNVDFAPQLGSAARLDTGDARLQSCVQRQASIWCAHTIFLPSGAPTRSAVQWWQLNPATSQVVQRGRVDDPTGAAFYAYPSIAVNRNGDVLVGYSRFSATQHVSANFSFRAAADPPNTLQPDTVFKPGEAPYRTGKASNRWGDYSATVVDPADDLSFWTIQEYAAAAPEGRPGRWGTWWAKVTPAGAGCTYTLSQNGALLPAGGGTGTVNVTAAAGCIWSAASNAPWITVRTGAGSVTYTVAPNSGGLRTGTITIASLTFTVTQAEFIALPDLAVVSVNAPAAATSGGRISAAATVRNQGAARSGTFRVGFYFGDVFGGFCNMAALDAGAQAVCTADVAAPPQPGAYFLRAVADDQGAVPESDETNNAFSPGQVTVTAPELPRPAAVVNAATFELGPVAPGEVVTLFGSGIGPPAAQSGLATLLGETRVWFDGTPAPLLYAQAGQVSAIVPFGVAGKPSTAVMVEYRGARSAPMNIPVVQAAPALFSAFAQVGDIVVLYGTGAGAMDPPLADGQVPAGAVSKPVLPVAVRIGGVDAEVLYAGQAPGIVAGVIQINVRVPAGMSGPVPAQLIVGTATSSPVNLSLQ